MQDTRPVFTIGAFAIIFNEEKKVLLCHRRDMDAWNLPGGGLEPGELPDEAVVREVSEETGLDVAVDHLAGVYAKPGRNDLVFSFVCKVEGGTLRETAESDACAYFSPNELPPNTLLRHAERIWDVLTIPEAPIFRRHTNPPREIPRVDGSGAK